MIRRESLDGWEIRMILLPYAREIADGDEDVPPNSWGEAVLAATYRGLCDGVGAP